MDHRQFGLVRPKSYTKENMSAPRKWESPGKSQIWNCTKGLLGMNLMSSLCVAW